jgi:hypothetical protein
MVQIQHHTIIHKENSVVILREEYRLRVFRNRVLGILFGTKREVVTED